MLFKPLSDSIQFMLIHNWIGKMNSILDVYNMRPDDLVMVLVRLGWTQEQIALEAGTGQATICHILSGKRKHPRYTTVVKLRDLVLRLNDLAPGEPT